MKNNSSVSRDSPGIVARVIAVKKEQGYVATLLRSDYGGIDRRKDSVTFSLANWDEVILPEVGALVELFDLKRHSKGWRAGSARSIRPASAPAPALEAGEE